MGYHGKDFWQVRHAGESWKEYVIRIVKLYDECGWWHVVPESALADRKAWRDGTAEAEFVYDEATKALKKR